MQQKIEKQAHLGVLHSKIQVELGLILNFTLNPRQSRICQRHKTPLGDGGGGQKKVYTEQGANRGGHRTSK